MENTENKTELSSAQNLYSILSEESKKILAQARMNCIDIEFNTDPGPSEVKVCNLCPICNSEADGLGGLCADCSNDLQKTS
jgi:hypothetical protein